MNNELIKELENQQLAVEDYYTEQVSKLKFLVDLLALALRMYSPRAYKLTLEKYHSVYPEEREYENV